jgi:hypothetical protein
MTGRKCWRENCTSLRVGNTIIPGVGFRRRVCRREKFILSAELFCVEIGRAMMVVIRDLFLTRVIY